MITDRVRLLSLFALLVCVACVETAFGEFAHPGVAHNRESIYFTKARIEAGEQPWTAAWKALKESRNASLDYKPQPFANVERGAYNNPDVGSSEFSDDAKAAYAHALCWVISGESAHAKKSAEIIDAWSKTLKSIGNHDARLLIGMSGYHFCIAAELLKHTDAEWPEEQQKQFAVMLREIWYPVIEDFYPSANGNWDASMLQVMMAMGVFLDDQVMFDRAKDYFLNGKGNGAIGNYFKESGQCQETGRDQGHTQMGLEFLANTCETAWIQGDDLYGALDNRLLKGFEYTAKYNLGFDDVPYEPYESFEGRYHYKKISTKARGRLRPMYERVYNHYHNRKGLDAPFTKQAALKLRASQTSSSNRGEGRRRRSRSSHLDTLMYAGIADEENAPATSHTETSKPNIVVFLADDMGWGDSATYGHELIQTPNLDKLAAQGVKFTQCYSACGVCSPSRSAILTGRTPYRNGVYRHLSGLHEAHLRRSEITYPKLLKTIGYETCHVGKWHLNSRPQFNTTEYPQPGDHGYDYWMATHNNAAPSHKNPNNFVRNGKPVGELKGYSAPLVATEASRWLSDIRDKSKPFALSIWIHEPHSPIATDSQFSDLYDGHKNSTYMGNITQLDHALGKVMESLDAEGVSDNTVVIFTSDNGPVAKFGGTTGGLRGGKRSEHEGGIRVPGIARWPGHIEPGTVSDIPVIGTDIFATVLDITGIPLPKDRTIDGVSMLSAFAGQPVERKVPLFWRTHVSPPADRVALRIGDWKLVGDETLTKFQLYEIQKDWKEERDLATEMPEKTEAMKRQLFKVWKDIEEEGPDEWWKNERQKPVRGGKVNY